jgi:hypothetical protein
MIGWVRISPGRMFGTPGGYAARESAEMRPTASLAGTASVGLK